MYLSTNHHVRHRGQQPVVPHAQANLPRDVLRSAGHFFIEVFSTRVTNVGTLLNLNRVLCNIADYLVARFHAYMQELRAHAPIENVHISCTSLPSRATSKTTSHAPSSPTRGTKRKRRRVGGSGGRGNQRSDIAAVQQHLANADEVVTPLFPTETILDDVSPPPLAHDARQWPLWNRLPASPGFILCARRGVGCVTAHASTWSATLAPMRSSAS